MELSAGSSSDNTQILLETGQKRKEILSKDNSSKRVRTEKKRVTFQEGTHFPCSEGLEFFKRRGFSQEDIDSASEYNAETGEYTPLMIKRGADRRGVKYIEIVPLTPSQLQKEKQRDLEFELNSVLPDSEWDYGFSVVEKAFGISKEITERHPLWNHEDRYPREVLMVMNALRVHFNIINPKPKEIFIEHLEELKSNGETEIREAQYYAFLAGYITFEESLDSNGTQNPKPKPFSEEEKQLEQLIKKYELIDADIQKLRNAAQKAPSLMKSIIALGLFGNEAQQASLLNELSRIYKNVSTPTSLLTKKTEAELRHIRRFVIALKQSLFRFINVAEQEFANVYDSEETTVTSE